MSAWATSISAMRPDSLRSASGRGRASPRRGSSSCARRGAQTPSRPAGRRSCAGGWSSAAGPRPRRGGGTSAPLPEAVRELVDADSAILEPATRERLCELIRREAVGLGPLEELLADPAVEEVMVNGHERVYVERCGTGGANRGPLPERAGASGRDRADPHPARPAGRRAQPDGRRPARGRLPGARRDPAAGRRRAVALDPALLGGAPEPRRAGRASEPSPRSCATSSPPRSAPGGASWSAAGPARARPPC